MVGRRSSKESLLFQKALRFRGEVGILEEWESAGRAFRRKKDLRYFHKERQGYESVFLDKRNKWWWVSKSQAIERSKNWIVSLT